MKRLKIMAVAGLALFCLFVVLTPAMAGKPGDPGTGTKPGGTYSTTITGDVTGTCVIPTAWNTPVPNVTLTYGGQARTGTLLIMKMFAGKSNIPMRLYFWEEGSIVGYGYDDLCVDNGILTTTRTGATIVFENDKACINQDPYDGKVTPPWNTTMTLTITMVKQ